MGNLRDRLFEVGDREADSKMDKYLGVKMAQDTKLERGSLAEYMALLNLN